MQIRSAAKWIAAAAGILVGAVIVGFTLKDTTYIEAKLEQIKGARQSVTAVEKTTAKTQKIKNAEIVKETPLPESSCISDFAFTGQMPELPTGCEITSLTMTLNYYLQIRWQWHSNIYRQLDGPTLITETMKLYMEMIFTIIL